MELKAGHIVTLNHDANYKFTVGAVGNNKADIYWFDVTTMELKMKTVPIFILRLADTQVIPKI